MTQIRKILLAYGVPLACLTVFYWVASDGHRPDGSPIREALYWIFFLILPLGYASFTVHLLPLVLCLPRQRLRARVISLLGGLVAPIIHAIAIAVDSDPLWGYWIWLLPITYCAGVAVVAMATTLTMKATRSWSRDRT